MVSPFIDSIDNSNMMLSNQDLRKAIADGELVLTPFSDQCIRSAGIAFHLGENLLRPLPGTVVDVKRKVVPEYEAITITDEKPYPLEPGGFVLGETFEAVTVGARLGFFIEGRSTLARIGLTIVQTAMIVDPGHENRTITLELANHGPNTILLYPKMKIARGAIFELKTPSSDLYDKNGGKYRNQTKVGRPIFDQEFLTEKD